MIFNSGGIFFLRLVFIFAVECNSLCTLLIEEQFSSTDSPSDDASVIASDVISIVALDTYD